MTALRRELRQYIALRRALGTRLQEPAATLERFLDFLEREKAEFITADLALRWAMQPQGVQRATWARRLGMVQDLLRGSARLTRALRFHHIASCHRADGATSRTSLARRRLAV